MAHPAETPPLMPYIPDQGRLARRQRAAQLLRAVLEEQIEPKLAINRWPEPITEPDPSMDCAYLALWHFEADEEKQHSELFYLDAQLELLRQMSRALERGENLPSHLLALYRPRKAVRFFQEQSPWSVLPLWLRHFWQHSCQSWQQALALLNNPPSAAVAPVSPQAPKTQTPKSL